MTTGSTEGGEYPTPAQGLPEAIDYLQVGPERLKLSSPEELSLRYQALSTELMGEALVYWAKLMRKPDGPRGQLALTLLQIVAALREETFSIPTDWERKLAKRAPQLLELAEKVLNDQRHNLVTESSSQLLTLVKEFR